jgi:hypothetical protein
MSHAPWFDGEWIMNCNVLASFESPTEVSNSIKGGSNSAESSIRAA